MHPERQAALRDIARVAGWPHAGEMVREILGAVMDRNVGRIHAIMRRIDKKVGVQLDLELMARPGGPVVSQKRVRRAQKAKKGVAPP